MSRSIIIILIIHVFILLFIYCLDFQIKPMVRSYVVHIDIYICLNNLHEMEPSAYVKLHVCTIDITFSTLRLLTSLSEFHSTDKQDHLCLLFYITMRAPIIRTSMCVLLNLQCPLHFFLPCYNRKYVLISKISDVCFFHVDS